MIRLAKNNYLNNYKRKNQTLPTSDGQPNIDNPPIEMLFPEHNYRFGQFDNEASVEDMASVLGC